MDEGEKARETGGECKCKKKKIDVFSGNWIPILVLSILAFVHLLIVVPIQDRAQAGEGKGTIW